MFKADEPKPKKLKQLTLLNLFNSKSSPKDESKKKSTFLSKLNQNRFAKRKFESKVEGIRKSSVDQIVEVDSTPPLPETKFINDKQTSSLLNALTECEKEIEAEIMENKMEAQIMENKMESQNFVEENCDSVAMKNDSIDLFEDDRNIDATGPSYTEPKLSVKPKEIATQENDTGNMSPLMFDSSQDFTDSLEIIEQDSTTNETTFSQQSNSSLPPTHLGMLFEDLKRTPHCSLPLPCLQSDPHHRVLFDTSEIFNPPSPENSLTSQSSYEDAWDQHHVKLPCSPSNLYPGGTGVLVKRWETIQSTLLMGIYSSLDLEEAVLTYNQRYCNKWSFRALHRFFTDVCDDKYREAFFQQTLPKMVELALSLPALCPKPIPLLKTHTKLKISLTQRQIACLLCNAFLCTFPRRNARHNKSEYAHYPEIHFNRLFKGTSYKEEAHIHKIKTILHYFNRVTQKMPTGVVTFERKMVTNPPLWSKSSTKLRGLHLNNEGLIDTHGQGMLQVDFANKYVGGGVLGSGLVQEEIRFIICPELIVSKLFTEVLADNECLVVTGAEQYSDYTGYAESYKWAGDFTDSTPRDNWGRRQTEIVAIDALHFSNPIEQYKTGNVQRELNKSFCGFHSQCGPDNSSAIATGKWGCGVFNGNPVLKCVIQLMAAAESGRDVCYFTFNDGQLMRTLHNMHLFIKLKNMTISDLWNSIVKYNTDVIQNQRNLNFYEYLVELYQNYNDLTDEDT